MVGGVHNNRGSLSVLQSWAWKVGISLGVLLVNIGIAFSQCPLPDAPGMPSVSPDPACANVQFCVTWNEVSGATSYEVGSEAGQVWLWTDVGNVTQSCYTAPLAGSYRFKVKAKNSCGTSGESPELTVTVIDPPGALATPSASSTSVCVNTQYCITWDEASGATSYEIQENGGSWTDVGDVTQACYTKLAADDFTYSVRAKNSCGTTSASVPVTVAVRQAIPAAAGALNASPNPGCVNAPYCISWEIVSGATSYEILEEPGSGLWRDVGDVLEVCYTTSTAGNYRYKIRGRNGCGAGDTSLAVTVTVVGVPEAPGAPSASPNPLCASGQYCITWTAVAGAISYEIQKDGGLWSDVGNVVQVCYTESVAGSYTFKVRAVNSCGASNGSPEATVVVGIPGTPATPSASPTPGFVNEEYCITWGTESGATSYEIQEDAGLWTNVGSVTQACYTKSAAGSHTYRIRGKNSCGTGNASGTTTVTVLQPIAVTVQTIPAGRSFWVDVNTYTSLQTFNWVSGSTHTIGTTSPQSDGAGTRYVWSNWSDGAGINHTVAPVAATTYTATFTTQYYLTVQVNPSNGGTVSSASNWFPGGQAIALQATAKPGYVFDSWTGSGSGSYTGTDNPILVTMNGPISQTANFVPSFSIQGTAFRDCNPQIKEIGLRVRLAKFSTGEQVQVDTTNGSGEYEFTNVPGGYYKIDLPDYPLCHIYDSLHIEANIANLKIKRICAADPDSPGLYTDVEETAADALPQSFFLFQNHPNPFNARTEIRFALENREEVSLIIYNVLGREIVKLLDQEQLSPGLRSVAWDGLDSKGNSVPSGVYFYRMTAGSSTETKKMVLLK